MNYIDIHCHLTGGEYEPLGGVDTVIRTARENGLKIIVCSGYDLDSSVQAKDLAERYPEVYFTAGFHPSELGKYRDGDFERLAKLCEHEKCIAVGEIGLDYHFDDNPDPSTQREAFVTQMRIASEKGLPFVVHSRDAAEETYEILSENRALIGKGALLHCYSYSPEMAERFLGLGMYFSFGGPITFKNSKKACASVQRIPATRILSETDCPYLTPVPHRGEFPNHPAHIPYIVSALATLKETDENTLCAQIEENAKTLFPVLKRS